MNKFFAAGIKTKIFISSIILVCILTGVAAAFLNIRNRAGAAFTQAEGEAVASICAADYREFRDITSEVMTRERKKKFPAVEKVFTLGRLYAFIVKPVAYNGPVTVALVIEKTDDAGDTDDPVAADGAGGADYDPISRAITDGADDGPISHANVENVAYGMTLGMRIISHTETPHYVRDMDSPWFTGRFAGKPTRPYLKLVRLKAREDNEIVAITGATVTAEGVVNGVNAAFGVFNEYIGGAQSDGVPYMVRFEPGAGDGPVETESLAIRAYGVVLAEPGLAEIRALPSVKRTMSVHTSTGTEQHAFRGTLLSNVLNYIDPGLIDEYTEVSAIGADGYFSGIGMDEVRAENSVFIMYEDNGEPLPKKNGEPGGMRIVVVDDVFGQRFTNYLLEITLENEAANE